MDERFGPKEKMEQYTGQLNASNGLLQRAEGGLRHPILLV